MLQKYVETFYGGQTAFTPAVVNTNTFKKALPSNGLHIITTEISFFFLAKMSLIRPIRSQWYKTRI